MPAWNLREPVKAFSRCTRRVPHFSPLLREVGEFKTHQPIVIPSEDARSR